MMSSEELMKVVNNSDKPKYVARYGDGEARVLDYFNDAAAAHMILKKHLGYIPSDREIREIRVNLIDAYKGADIIGIPTPRHERKGGHWGKANDLLMENVNLEGKGIASIDFHSEWLAGNVFRLLLDGRDKIYCVTCRDVADSLMKHYQIGEVKSYLIPPEADYTKYSGEPHYPFRFNKVKEWIYSHAMTGKIFLLGGGIVGKMYGLWAKERGAIAIDIGHVFDKWAGKNTRGPNRGRFAQDNTYKL